MSHYRELGPGYQPLAHESLSEQKFDEASMARFDSLRNLAKRFVGSGESLEEARHEITTLFQKHIEAHLDLDEARAEYDNLPDDAASKGSMRINLMKAEKHLKESHNNLPPQLRD